MRTSILPLVATAILSILFAQVPTEVRFSTLPPFTESSLLPTDGSAHAFFDLVANQIVIVPGGGGG